MSQKFKAGDRVVRINAHLYSTHKDGSTGVITSGCRTDDTNDPVCTILWDGDSIPNAIEDEYLELEEQKVTIRFEVGDRVRKINSKIAHAHADGDEGVIINGRYTRNIPQTACNISWDEKTEDDLCPVKFLELIDEDIKYKTLSFTIDIKQNNDGRSTCYACGAPTEDREGLTSVYQICTKCGK